MKPYISVVIAWVAATATAAEKHEVPFLTIEPCWLSVSRAKEDLWGASDIPAGGGVGMSARPLCGTHLMAMVLLPSDFRGKLVKSACEPKAFRDDRGKDLMGEANRRWRNGDCFENKQLMTVYSAEGQQSLGIAFRSPAVLSTNASGVVAEGVLNFVFPEASKAVECDAFELSTGKVVRVGPVRLRFDRPGELWKRRMPAARAYRAVTNRQDTVESSRKPDLSWSVQVLADEGVVDPKLLIYGSDEDVPLLSTMYQSGMTVWQGNGGSIQTNDVEGVFSGVSWNCFQCPEGHVRKVKVRYYPQAGVTTVPFRVETGLGLERR